MTIGDRLKQVRTAIGGSQAAFATTIGVKQSYLGGIERGEKDLSRELIAQLISVHGVNANWLLTGEGEMMLANPMPVNFMDIPNPTENRISDEPIEVKGDVMPKTTPDVPDSELITLPGFNEGFNQVYLGYPKDVQVVAFRKGNVVPVKTAPNDPTGMVLLPLFNQGASAGPGEVPTQLPETDSLVPVLYDVLGYRDPKYCGVIRVCGDSMSDLTLFNGDWALFDRSDKHGDGVFVISLFGDFRIKRLQYRLSTQEIVIMSENRNRYPDPEVVKKTILDEGHLKIYGRVFGWLHKHQH